MSDFNLLNQFTTIKTKPVVLLPKPTTASQSSNFNLVNKWEITKPIQPSSDYPPINTNSNSNFNLINPFQLKSQAPKKEMYDFEDLAESFTGIFDTKKTAPKVRQPSAKRPVILTPQQLKSYTEQIRLLTKKPVIFTPQQINEYTQPSYSTPTQQPQRPLPIRQAAPPKQDNNTLLWLGLGVAAALVISKTGKRRGR